MRATFLQVLDIVVPCGTGLQDLRCGLESLQECSEIWGKATNLTVVFFFTFAFVKSHMETFPGAYVAQLMS